MRLELNSIVLGASISIMAGLTTKPISTERLAALGLPTTADREISVSATRYDVDEYTVMDGRVVTADSVPTTLTMAFDVDKATYLVYPSPNAASVRFDCDARWLPVNAAVNRGDMVWPATQGAKPFALISPPGMPPTIVPETLYTFWHVDLRAWVKCPAMQFTRASQVISPGTNVSINPTLRGGIGMIGVWCLRRVINATEWQIMGFTAGGRSMQICIDTKDNLLLRVDGVIRQACRIAPYWFDQPLALALAYYPQHRTIEMTANTGGTPPTTVLTTLTEAEAASMFAGQVGLMTSDAELSVELLDFALWQRELTRDKIAAAMGVYNRLYGI